VDGTSASDAVIQEAARRPWQVGSEFKLVSVVDPFFFTKTPHLLDEFKNTTLEGLKVQAAPLLEAGWQVDREVALGNPRHALSLAASSWHADLVFVGSHVHSAVERLLMGSTAQAVLRHAPCSVEIVRVRETDAEKPTRGGMCVIVATDGSEFAELALHRAAERPWPPESEFKVISCSEYPVWSGEYAYYSQEQLTELVRTSRDHADEAALNGEQLLVKAGLKATHEVTEAKDTPTGAILAAAEQWKADLIVLGSHGRRGFDRLILGSVSETVALHAGCSVEVVRKTQRSG
jgi:nucleotide-binding universal stress UspA family protein